MDDASYVQQPWEQGVHNEQIKEILSQFSNTQELLKLQMNIFGVSEKHLDPHLHTPNLAVLSVNSNNGKKETGKRVERSNDMTQPASKKKKVEESSEQVSSVKTAQNHVLNERQRRLKMNQKIQSLKELLPKSCADILSNKLAILHESVQHIKNLHVLVEQLNERNHYLDQRLATVEKELTIFHTNIINNNNNSLANINNANTNNINPPTPNSSMNNSNNSNNTNNSNNNTNSNNASGNNIAPLSVDPMTLQFNSYSPQYTSQFPISHANPAHFYHSNSNFSLY